MNRSLSTALALVLTLPAWGASARAGSAAGSSGGSLSPVASTVVSAMDKAADPCVDFYRYACGGWLDSTKLPADQSRWGRGFTEIAERNRAALKTILEESAKNPGADPARKKLGDYYSACMDEAKVDALGAKPIEPLLKEIAAIQNPKSLMQVVGKQSQYSIPALFGGAVVPDFKNPDQNLAYFTQGGIGLPDRDYYLKEDEKSVQTRADYKAHMTRMFQLLGESEADAKLHTEQVVAFETDLARVSRPRVELRDPVKTYNKLDIGGLKALTPGLDWDAYLAATGYPNIKEINVAVPEFFEGLEKLVATTPKDNLQAYARWSVLRSTAALLS
jgi:putative endopeptidase